MAIKIAGTTVVDDNRALTNIASVDATTVAALGAAGVGGGSELEFTAGGTIAEGNTVSVDPNSPHLAFAGASPAINYTSLNITQFITKVYFDSTRTGGQVLVGSEQQQIFSSVDLLNRTKTDLVSGVNFGRGANTVSSPYIKTTTGGGAKTFKVVMTNHNVQGKLAIHNGTNGAETNLDASILEGCAAFPVGSYNFDGGDGIAIWANNPHYWIEYQTYRINDYNSITKGTKSYLAYSASRLTDAVQLPSGKIIATRWATGETRPYLCCITCNGYNSAPTFSEVQVGPASDYDYYSPRILFNPSNENNLFVVSSGGTSYYPVSLSGTTLTVGTKNTTSNYGNGFTNFSVGNMAYDVGASKWNVGANSSSGGNWAEVTFPTSTTLGLTQLIPYNVNLQASVKVALQDTSSANIKHIIAQHAPNSTSNYAVLEYDSSIGPGSAPASWVGIAASSATQGQTVKVHPIGAKVGGFSGIVPFSKYYVSSSDPNVITTTNSGNQFRLGIGVSSTEIIIVGTNGSINW